MDISSYDLKDLILAAMKSEIDSKDIYEKLAERVKNFMLKDRLEFLAKEEEKHRKFFDWLFKENFPDQDIVTPEKSRVPLPDFFKAAEKIKTEQEPIEDVLKIAMDAENSAFEFYRELAKQFESKPEIQRMLEYIASMEMGHFRILDIELESYKKYKDFDVEWPMMHIGP